MPSMNTAISYLPNFFTEGKGLNKNTAVCKRQALYNGALGARKIYKLQLYVNLETAYDNNTYMITSTYYGGTGALKLYSIYLTPSISPDILIKYRII